MISRELAAKYHLPPIESYPFTELEWYQTFLKQTDYVVYKIAESIYLGEELENDYTEILQARKFARQMVNQLL